MMNKVCTCKSDFHDAVIAAIMMTWLVVVVTLTPHGVDAFASGTAAGATATITNAFAPKSSPAPRSRSRFFTERPSPRYRPFLVDGYSSAKSESPSCASRTSPSMCICIDCARVTDCAAYHFVETKHDQPHMTDRPTFEPRPGSPTIHVNVRTVRNNADRRKEIERMWREHRAETKRAESIAAAAAAEKKRKEQDERDEKVGGQSSSSARNEKLYSETVYDFTPITTYEYDVVKCEDYVHDEGCWVRNMPQEIRDANPNFVPS